MSSGERVPYLPILEHPLRSEIDERLFVLQENTKAVYRWIEDKSREAGDVVPFSYHMLWRYQKSTSRAILTEFVPVEADRALRRNFEVLDLTIQKWEAALKSGMVPSTKDALAAVRIQNQLIAEYGGRPDVVALEADAKDKLQRLIAIIEGIMTEDQIALLVELIMQDEDLREWSLPAGAGE